MGSSREVVPGQVHRSAALSAPGERAARRQLWELSEVRAAAALPSLPCSPSARGQMAAACVFREGDLPAAGLRASAEGGWGAGWR